MDIEFTNDETDKVNKKKIELKKIALNNFKFENSNKQEKKKLIELKSFKEKVINFYLKRILYCDIIGAFLSTLGFLLAIVESEIYYNGINKENRYVLSNTCNALRSIIWVCTIILANLLFIRYYTYYKLDQEKYKTNNKGFLYSSNFKTMVIFLLLDLIQPFPGLHQIINLQIYNQKYQISVSGILSIIMIIRIHMFFRLYSSLTEWKDITSEILCEKENCKADLLFTLRAELKEKPFIFLAIMLMWTIVFFGFMIRIFERNYQELNEDDQFNTIWNAMWFTWITITTVGFGDIYIYTDFGKILAVISIFIGIFIVSLLVVSLTNSITLNTEEKHSFNILYRLKIKPLFINKAALLITYFIKSIGAKNERANNLDKLNPQWITEIDTRISKFEMLKEFHKNIFKQSKIEYIGWDPSFPEAFKLITIQFNNDLKELISVYSQLKKCDLQLNYIINSQTEFFNCIENSIIFLSKIRNKWENDKNNVFTYGNLRKNNY